MKIIYRDSTLQRLAEDPYYKPKKWSSEVIKTYQKKILIISSATSELDIRAIKSLHLEKLQGDRRETYSIRINRQFRLIISFEIDNDGQYVAILELTNHYR